MSKKRTLGIEREWFIMRNGNIVAGVGDVLPKLWEIVETRGFNKSQFGYELFAGQIEDRTEPVPCTESLIDSLKKNEALLKEIGESLGLHFVCKDFVTEEELGELVVNPFDQRHKSIWAEITRERKVAASQVAAIHIHVSVTPEEAVQILNYCRRSVIDRLAKMGDFSQGKRLNAYRVMAKVYGDSPVFKDVDHLMKYIKDSGGERDVWDMVRYKPSTGTVEFRMFGATGDLEKIKSFVCAVQEVIKGACERVEELH